MIAALLLAQASPELPPNFPNGIETTIEQVRADPRRWHGKWIKLTGWMNRCTPLDCVVAEQPTGRGMTLSFEPVETFDRWVEPLLPAQVVVVARLDSECLLNICTDRAPVLRQPFVMTLRWNVNNPAEESH